MNEFKTPMLASRKNKFHFDTSIALLRGSSFEVVHCLKKQKALNYSGLFEWTITAYLSTKAIKFYRLLRVMKS